MISSNALERWLISITDIPTPASVSICARASSKTGTGKTAGPALKLKIRSVISLGEGVRVLGVEAGETTTPYTQNPKPNTLSFLRMRSYHCTYRTQNQRARHQPLTLYHEEVHPP